MTGRDRRRAIALLAAAFSGCVPTWAEDVVVPKPADPIPAAMRDLVQKYCLDCHSGDEPSGGVELSAAANLEDLFHQSRSWNKVVRVVRDRTMPPESAEKPTDDERRTLSDWIERALRDVACRQPRYPGTVTVRRLNRVEYDHTLSDLLGLKVEAAKDLPADAAGNGFDNQGDTLYIPPVLLEKYLDATRRVVTQAIADPNARARLMVATPTETVSELEAARLVLASFVPRAFRRPAREEELAVRVKLVEEGLARGESWESAIRSAVESTLLSPHFLFRVEEPRESAEPYRITDHELAVRLSYFLWSTMPDRELTDFANQGRLHEPETLRVQVQRMLADPRSAALANDFASQWFGYRDMRTMEMDIRRFGKFNGVREAMHTESVTFFDRLFRENASLLDILDSNYVYVNDRLAAHYGLSGVSGGEFQRVALPDRRRGGVLGMGSTLVVTSYPTRTSPVLRGKWVLEQVLGTPPPPPPPEVKPISRDDQMKDGMTLRQRFEKHRAEASCAGCHARMDPIGFGLENYDGIGEWREQDNGLPIDASARLPDGTDVRGPEGLKDALLARKDLFVRHAVEKMLTYALGRPVEAYDECMVRETMDKLSAEGYRSQVLIHAIVESHAFQYRRQPE